MRERLLAALLQFRWHVLLKWPTAMVLEAIKKNMVI
jgi:hypothetical protein